MTIAEHNKFSDSSNFVLKMKLIDVYRAGDGYKKISKHFQLTVSTVRNVIKKWQLGGSVAVKARFERPRKFSDRVLYVARKAKQNPHIAAEDLQECFTDTGVRHHSTVQCCLHKHDLHVIVIKRKASQ